MRLHPRAVRLLPLLLPVLLLPLRGEASGESVTAPGCTPVDPTPVSSFANPGSAISEIAAVGGTLFFFANDGSSGFRLWKSQGGGAPQRMDPLLGRPPWPPNVQRVTSFAVMGQRLVFVVRGDFLADVWATDETHTGIYPIKEGITATSVDEGLELTVLGSTLFFRGADNTDPPVLWMSDGMSAQKILVNQAPIAEASELTVFNGRLFFAAKDSTAGRELWSVGEAGTDAGRVADLRPGTEDSTPASLTVMGGKLYFTATTPAAQNAELWRIDEREVLQTAVHSDTLGTSYGSLEQLTAVGDKLFFRMEQSLTGKELWVTDGTDASTRILEIQPGLGDGSPDQLTAVGRMLFFIANDGVTGPEPWRSDGTVAGTSLLREFKSGTEDSLEDKELRSGAGVLLLSIFEDNSGRELFSVSDTEIVRLTDIVLGPGHSRPHGMTVLRDKLYFAAESSGQGQELYSLPLMQLDCHVPSVECPGPLTVEAASPMGALVFLPPPRMMSDNSYTPLTVTYSPASLWPFPLGTSTPVTITVTDRVGRSASCSPIITVRDTTKPELVCPRRLVEEAASAAGTNVSFPLLAWDAVSGVFVSTDPPSGTLIGLNEEREVLVTATDGATNVSTCRFFVTVKDTQPPGIQCPDDIVKEASREQPPPYIIPYEVPLPSDDVFATASEDPRYPSGRYAFDLGRTEVVLTATDSSNNTSQCSFSVYVVDPAAPTITCPGHQQAVATGPEGAVVEFPEAEAEDEFGPPTILYSAEPGSTFPVGETTVVATARDRGGNQTSCSFTVTVTEREVPHSGCGCRAGSDGATVYWLLLALVPLWARRRAGRLAR